MLVLRLRPVGVVPGAKKLPSVLDFAIVLAALSMLVGRPPPAPRPGPGFKPVRFDSANLANRGRGSKLQGGLDVVNRIFKHVFETTHRCGPEDPEGVVSPRAQNNSAVVSLCAANVGGERGARLAAGCSRALTSG